MIARAVVSAATLLALGCATVPPQVGEPGPKLAEPEQEKAYTDLLGRYTRHGEVYDQFDTRMFAAATYQSWTFREARVKRVAIFQTLPPAEVARRLADERAEHDRELDFFFGAHLNNNKFEDFDRPNSVWRIVVVTRAGELAPSKIERLGRSDLNMRALYPYTGEFWTGWKLSFPRTMADGTPVLAEGEKELTLRVASTLGKIELTYPVE